MTALHATRDDLRIAYLAALAIAIHVAEAALPSPVPGIKPGLANIVTVAVLCRFNWRLAAAVSLLRVLAGSLIVGTLLSPTFYLSASGSLGALLALGLAQRLPGISAVGLSVTAALAHMTAQFSIAYALFIPHPALLGLLPVLLSAALGFGLVNGFIAAAMLRRLGSEARELRAQAAQSPPNDGKLAR